MGVRIYLYMRLSHARGLHKDAPAHLAVTPTWGWILGGMETLGWDGNTWVGPCGVR